MDRALCPVLVGREREVSLLEDALLAAHRGSGQVVVIAGEAGVGKTRLAMELQERARRAGTAVMVGTTSEAEVALPYLPFIEAIGNYLAGADLDRIKLQLGPATCRQLGQLLPQFELQTTLIDPGEPAQAAGGPYRPDQLVHARRHGPLRGPWIPPDRRQWHCGVGRRKTPELHQEY